MYTLSDSFAIHDNLFPRSILALCIRGRVAARTVGTGPHNPVLRLLVLHDQTVGGVHHIGNRRPLQCFQLLPRALVKLRQALLGERLNG